MIDDEMDNLLKWKLYVDGSSTKKRSRAGIIVIAPEQITLDSTIRFGFKASNNEVEYEALLVGLRLLRSVDAEKI